MPIKMHKWSDVKRRTFSPEKLQKLEAATAQDVLEYNLRELREASGLTQVEMAERLESVQSSVARMEAGADSKLSTIRKYVTALGGEVKIQAVIKGKTVELVV